jgi:hypothetical protein
MDFGVLNADLLSKQFFGHILLPRGVYEQGLQILFHAFLGALGSHSKGVTVYPSSPWPVGLCCLLRH